MAAEGQQAKSPAPRGRPGWRRFLETDIWEYGVGGEPSLKGQWVALLRILSISWRGLFENLLFSRAAALSYSSLLALGPLVAVSVVLSGSLVEADAQAQIKRALLFVAPSLQEMIARGEDGSRTEQEMANALDTLIDQIVVGGQELMSQVNTAGSRAFGALGSLVFIWAVIQLLTAVETSLNRIWGVHQGRPWIKRIVYYWTFMSLGAVLGLGSTALFSASNLAGQFDWVPFGGELAALVMQLSPWISFAMLVLLLILFYRFFPNTSVGFRPALVGSLLTASLLFLNNYLGILYVHRVISLQSLYGSVGIIPVLMLGLYFFWVLVLLGGQLTYAVQNVSFLANQAAWRRVSQGVRELVTLAAFLVVARRFQACERAPTLGELSRQLQVPSNILNESLELLESIGWTTRIRLEAGGEDTEITGYRPARPLASYSLSGFRQAFELAGNSAMRDNLLRTDPLLLQYADGTRSLEQAPLFRRDLQALLAESPAGAACP